MIQTPTGGHYSLLRATLGLTVAGVLVATWWAPAEGTLPAPWLLALGLVASIAFALGWQDRAMAVVLLPTWWILLGPASAAVPSGQAAVLALLLAHLLTRGSPYGSWAARGRTDPRGDFGVDRLVMLGLWALLGLAYAGWSVDHWMQADWRGGTALQGLAPGRAGQGLTWATLAAETLFLPLALWAPARPWIWSLLLARQWAAVFLEAPAASGIGMVLLHLWTFSPAWVAPRRGAHALQLFYDGTCGLCHRTVRFLLAEDRTGQALRFAPLEGPTFSATVPDEVRRTLPDSFVARREDGTLEVRSGAVLLALEHLGGAWRALGMLLRLVPRPLRDRVYDGIAGARHRWFRPPPTSCPILPPDLLGRFDP